MAPTIKTTFQKKQAQAKRLRDALAKAGLPGGKINLAGWKETKFDTFLKNYKKPAAKKKTVAKKPAAKKTVAKKTATKVGCVKRSTGHCTKTASKTGNVSGKCEKYKKQCYIKDSTALEEKKKKARALRKRRATLKAKKEAADKAERAKKRKAAKKKKEQKK